MKRTIAAAFAACLTLALLGTTALAHARFASSTPAPGQTLASSPASVVITFTEELAQGSTGSVTDAAGARVDTAATIDANARTKLSIALKPSLPNGVYKVAWHSIAEDDAAVLDGTFFFGVGVPAPSTSTAPGLPAMALLIAGLAVLLASLALLPRRHAPR
jgi:methionine-rich copper-binding protein CopC